MSVVLIVVVLVGGAALALAARGVSPALARVHAERRRPRGR
jgi:hypothetical protein